MKKTIKNKKYSYIVDLRDIERLEDIAPTWAFAKQKAGLALTDDELAEICAYVYDTFGPKITVVNMCNCPCKKLPWYKRFWRWLTKPFKKNK